MMIIIDKIQCYLYIQREFETRENNKIAATQVHHVRDSVPFSRRGLERRSKEQFEGGHAQT